MVGASNEQTTLFPLCVPTAQYFITIQYISMAQYFITIQYDISVGASNEQTTLFPHCVPTAAQPPI